MYNISSKQAGSGSQRACLFKSINWEAIYIIRNNLKEWKNRYHHHHHYLSILSILFNPKFPPFFTQPQSCHLLKTGNRIFGSWKKKSFFFLITPDYTAANHLSHNQAAHLPVRLLQLHIQTEEARRWHRHPDELDDEMSDEQQEEEAVVIMVMMLLMVDEEVQEAQDQGEEV